MPARHLSLGRQGEDFAAAMLRGKGYTILARNWRSKQLELDLICELGDAIVFVEVKTRGPGAMGRPDQGLNKAKQRRLARAASLFLSEKKLWERPCRFDLVSVTESNGKLRGEHVENAFELETNFGAVGGGNSHWQPW